MSNFTENFTTSVDFTTQSIGLVDIINISMYSISFLFGLPTHSYVIWLITRGSGSGFVSEFFIFNLSICEICNCLNNLICIFDRFIPCKHLGSFLSGLAITGSPLFQCLICVERYLAVLHPVTFLKYKPLRYKLICCSMAWIITLGSCLSCMLTFVFFYVYVCFFSLQYMFFISFQLFCLVAVLRALKQSGPGERAREREEENHMKRRAFYLILITTVSMVITYVPYIIAGFTFILTQHHIRELFSFSIICNVLAGFVQPVLYLHRVYEKCPNLLRRLWKLLKRIRKKESVPSSWQKAVGCLVPKEEGSVRIGKFRTISLLSTECKTFFSVVAKRISTYMIDNGYFNTSIQKGGISGFAGFLEHTGVISQMIHEARMKKGD
ncbi:uracil nucleotide/cysteinyl leukotriene receptor-like [Carassius gibelio]|uniref:uracil nucleotide/cysteinyl leukotriene receptor-like n=1 Tax=Carassius gibelio TaxID=101364 RepID=UPI002278F083|nr:uracil nucleotide/cysteinyl leukotriene receptor-like [Carassius gibelio]